MASLSKSKIPVFILGLMGLVMLMSLFSAPVFAADPEIVASGLDSPRGITFGSDGTLYIAEAGTGGEGPCMPGPEGGDVCFGASGSVTSLLDGVQTRIATGFPSLAAPDGSAAAGPHDVAIRGDDVYVLIGLGADPAVRDGGTIPDPSGDFATLVRLLDSGAWETVADIAAHETAENPHDGALDSNPYSLLATADGFIVADAGGNDLLALDADNNITTLAVFADTMVDAPGFMGLPEGTQIPSQAVPTTVVSGPDGLYVGQLTGFPFPAGGANVYTVADGGEPTVLLDGFTNISDIAVEDDGTIWVLEIAANSLLAEAPAGALTKVSPDGTREVVLSEGLIMPTGVAIGPDGNLYITNCGVCPGGGHILSLSLAEPEPPETGDYSLTPLMGALVGAFGLMLVIGGGMIVRRRSIRA